MSFGAISLVPVYGGNYLPGYIGFSYKGDSFVSRGITFFQKWDTYSDIRVSHCMIVSGPNECIEATLSGVKASPLEPYFNDLRTCIFFRKPKHFTPELGEDIVTSAEKHLGHKYGLGLILAHILRRTLTGKLLGVLGFDFMRFLDNPRHEICSELVALAMSEQRMLAGLGCLKLPAQSITPQQLFEDEVLFSPWRYSVLA